MGRTPVSFGKSRTNEKPSLRVFMTEIALSFKGWVIVEANEEVAAYRREFFKGNRDKTLDERLA